MTTVEAWPPCYVSALARRQSQLRKIRADPKLAYGAFEYYRTRPVEFIEHWIDTYDPRNAGGDVPARLPFIPFKRQREFVQFLLACIEGDASGLVEKARDMGATWVCCAFSVWLWLFWPGVAIGWGSRKEQLVDKIGDPDSIFQKMRMIIMGLPREFLPAGFSVKDHMGYMKIVNPETGATITGEAGDNIGRGGRKRIYFKDESAHYERPELIEAALGDNTRVQIDISSVHGLGNVFHRRRESGLDWEPGQEVSKRVANVFVMDWRDHPAKDQAWYDARRQKAVDEGLLHVHAQEVDRNYAASLEGVICPSEWVAAALDAHIKLKFNDDGPWAASLDVADGGGDSNAFLKKKGVILKHIEEWGEVDTGKTSRRAASGCAPHGSMALQYDCIGVGSGIKAETNRLAEEGVLPKGLRLVPWNAGAKVDRPDDHIIRGDKNTPLNKDFFGNFKAQAWWALRRRFEKTYRAINEGVAYPSDELISLPSDLPLVRKLQKELSQPTRDYDSRMRLIVDKTPEGTRSPNLADALVMLYFPAKGGPRPLEDWV
jgi:phage terminase large subunit